MQLHIATASRAQSPGVPGEVTRQPFRAEGVKLRHLQGEEAIASVLHLREEIDLSVHAAAGPQFAALEKKETSAVLSSVSSSTAN